MLEDSSNNDDWLRLGEVAGRLHEMARVYNIILMTAMQLNRPQPPKGNKGGKSNNDNTEESVGVHRIARSYSVISHCDFVIQIQTRIDEKSYSDIPLHILKNRSGEIGSCFLKKCFKNSSITDLPFEVDQNNDIEFNEYNEYKENSGDISAFLEKENWNKN